MSTKRWAYLSCGAALLLSLLLLLTASYTTVPAGSVAVVTSFGEVQGEPLDAGFHWLAFWKRATLVSLQTQEDKEESSTPTKEGLIVSMDVSVLYSVQKDKVVGLFQNVGVKYKDVVVTPQFRSAIRDTTARYKAEDLYTARRADMEADLEQTVKKMLEERGITCERVLLRNVILPQTVTTAIQRKMASEQEAAAMEFVILKETKEAERKRVEAKGIADSQHIIQGTLSDPYLRYLWIKSLQEAAQHNATLIYIPTGNDGIPFFSDASKSPKRGATQQ